MKNNPLVSVVIPNYNHAQFLPKRIESVLNQTYNNTEVIILDDCSSDNSKEIIEKYAKEDSRIITLFNSQNSGNTFKQWKQGLDLAKGDYVWIAESDDYADTTFLETLLSILNKNPNAGIAYCQSNFINTNSEVIGNHIENLKHLDSTLWESDFCMKGEDVLSKYMIVLNIIPNASAVIFNRSLIEHFEWNRLFEFKLGGDRFFWISLLRYTKLCFISESLNYFRIEGETQRKKHIHTVQYLNEIGKNVRYICSTVKVKTSSKTNALRQWFRYFKTAKRANENGVVPFTIKSFFVFIRLLSIYFY